MFFQWQLIDNKTWRARIGYPFDVRDRHVIDLGCGHGALSLALAQEGAASVLGIDLDEKRLRFADQVAQDYRESYPGRLHFKCVDLNQFADGNGSYDLVVTKDTFEHVEDLPALLASIARLLRPGGLLIAGFSPLYFSPFGDHGRWELGIPWLHAVVPERLLALRLKRRRGQQVARAADLGLNKLTLRQFRSMIDDRVWHTESFRVNPKEGRLIRAFDLLRRLPGCEKYFTVGIYTVLRKHQPERMSVP